MALTRFQDTEGMDQDVDFLVKEIERLRVMYEQYFMGLIKENPEPRRERVNRIIRQHHGVPIQNARLKFRFQQSVARYNTYCTYWDRTLRKIEEGTYERDVFRANLNLKAHEHGEMGTATDSMFDLYHQYQEAKDGLKQKLDNVSYKKFQAQLTQKRRAIEQKHKGHDISFKIETENGKVKIKPVAKKKKT
jgi:hypothetical protein